MKTSMETNEISAALAKAQGEMEVAPKDSVNPHFKSSYANLAACVRAARPALAKHGLCVIQSIEINETAKMIGVLTRVSHASGQFFEADTWCQPRSLAPQDIGSCATYLKRYGFSAMVGLITEEDDDGEAAQGRPQAKSGSQPNLPFSFAPPGMNQPVATKPSKPADPVPAAVNDAPPKYAYGNGNATKGISEAQVKRLYALKHKAGWHDQELKQYMQAEFKVASTNALNREQYDKICGLLESRTPFVEAFMAHDVPPPSEEPLTDRGGAYDPTLDEIPF